MSKFKSRKFWMDLAGALVPTVLTVFTGAIDPVEALTASSAVVISYIFGQAYVDANVVEIESDAV